MASVRWTGSPGARWSSSVFFPSCGPRGFGGNRIPATFRRFDRAATSPRTRYGATFRIFSDQETSRCAVSQYPAMSLRASLVYSANAGAPTPKAAATASAAHTTHVYRMTRMHWIAPSFSAAIRLRHRASQVAADRAIASTESAVLTRATATWCRRIEAKTTTRRVAATTRKRAVACPGFPERSRTACREKYPIRVIRPSPTGWIASSGNSDPRAGSSSPEKGRTGTGRSTGRPVRRRG